MPSLYGIARNSFLRELYWFLTEEVYKREVVVPPGHQVLGPPWAPNSTSVTCLGPVVPENLAGFHGGLTEQ